MKLKQLMVLYSAAVVCITVSVNAQITALEDRLAKNEKLVEALIKISAIQREQIKCIAKYSISYDHLDHEYKHKLWDLNQQEATLRDNIKSLYPPK